MINICQPQEDLRVRTQSSFTDCDCGETSTQGAICCHEAFRGRRKSVTLNVTTGKKNPTGDALKRLPVRGQDTGGWHDLVGNALKGNLGNWNLEYLLSTNCQHQTSDRFPVRMQPNLKGLPCHMSINTSFPLIGSCFICSPRVDESLTQDPPTLHCQQLFCSTSSEVAEYCWLFMVSCCQDAAGCFLCGCPLKVLHCPPPEKNKWQKARIKVLLLGNTSQT